MFRFVSTLRKNARDIVENENPDVVITSSTYPLDTFAGQKMKKIKKIVFTNDLSTDYSFFHHRALLMVHAQDRQDNFLKYF